MTEPTSENLARALEAAGAPAEMIQRARQDFYHDYKSPLAMPEMQLYKEARAAGLHGIAEGVMAGEFDASKEESDAWAASPEGQEVYAQFVKDIQENHERPGK